MKKPMKTLILLLFSFFSFQGTTGQPLEDRIKTRTSGQIKVTLPGKKDSQNETRNQPIFQKMADLREKKIKGRNFKFNRELQSEVELLKGVSSSEIKKSSEKPALSSSKKEEKIKEKEKSIKKKGKNGDIKTGERDDGKREEKSERKTEEEVILKDRKDSSSKGFRLPGELESEIKNLRGGSSYDEPVKLNKSSKSSFDLEVLEEVISVLDKESPGSERYKKEVQSLETSVYNHASLNSLEVLADIFNKKEDTVNQIQVLEIMASNYPENPRSHYLLGVAYKKVYLESTAKDEDEAKSKAIESLSRSIRLNRKYQESYEELLPLLTESGHNQYSLELIKDMIRYFSNPKNYVRLCEAYYETNFVKQTRKACRKAIEENPGEPTAPLFLAFVQEEKKNITQKVEEAAENFPDSYVVQFKTGLFFLKSNPTLAIKYLKRAVTVQPRSHKAQNHLAWLLFNDNQVKKSYEHFFQSCVHSQGVFMKDFQKATAMLGYKKQSALTVRKWKKGIDKCFQSLKAKK